MQEVSNLQTKTNLWAAKYLVSNNQDHKVTYFLIRRIFDTIIILLSSIFVLPLVTLIATVIKLDSSGPVLFVQERIGARLDVVDGNSRWVIQPFSFYKFRTMWHGTDSELHRKYMEAYIDGDEKEMLRLQPDAENKDSYKLKGDPRVTRFGHFLRKTSMDELPQLWNVLRGEMSLVGPRPAIPYEVEKYQSKHLNRLGTLPGITGLWQVSGRCETTFEEMVQLDLEYIEKQSIMGDLKILFLTIPVVISEKGAG